MCCLNPKTRHWMIVFILSLGMLVAARYAPILHAQVTTSDMAITLPMTTGQDGDIVCLDKTGYIPCVRPYDSTIVGVITATPAAVFDNESLTDKRFVVDKSKAVVRVSTQNGPIHKGDFVTSSAVAGVGQLANRNGFILGIALDTYDSTDKQAVSQLPVSLSIHSVTTISDARDNLL